MLGARFASSEKVPELDFSRRSAGRHVGFVQDEGASIVVATQQPSVAVLAVVNLALAIGHLGLRRSNQPRPSFVPQIAGPGLFSPSPSAPKDSVCIRSQRGHKASLAKLTSSSVTKWTDQTFEFCQPTSPFCMWERLEHGENQGFEHRTCLDFSRNAKIIRRLLTDDVHRYRAVSRCRLEGPYEREIPNPVSSWREARRGRSGAAA